MAYAAKGQITEAKNESEALQKLMREEDMMVRNGTFNTPKDAANVGLQILLGTIADKENNREKAIRLLKAAVAQEDELVYDEPKDWLTPARSYLGYIHLKYNQFTEAASVFTASLKKDPGEPLAKKGLALAKARKND